MKGKPRTGFAIAAIFPAVLVPTLMPALRRVGAPDFATGLFVGVAIGLSILLIALALKARPA